MFWIQMSKNNIVNLHLIPKCVIRYVSAGSMEIFVGLADFCMGL